MSMLFDAEKVMSKENIYSAFSLRSNCDEQKVYLYPSDRNNDSVPAKDSLIGNKIKKNSIYFDIPWVIWLPKVGVYYERYITGKKRVLSSMLNVGLLYPIVPYISAELKFYYLNSGNFYVYSSAGACAGRNKGLISYVEVNGPPPRELSRIYPLFSPWGIVYQKKGFTFDINTSFVYIGKHSETNYYGEYFFFNTKIPSLLYLGLRVGFCF